MILLATLISMALLVWSLVLTRQPGTATGKLYGLAVALFLGTGLAWGVVLIGLSGSLWALLQQQGEAREQMALAGLGVAAVSGVALLLACLPALLLLVLETRALVSRIDASRPPVRIS